MIVLVGFMGAGKTTVGRLLAQRLGRPFVDTDLAIEQRAGRAIPAIFSADGEPAFRDLEQDVVGDVLRGPEAVVSLGGGACERPATRGVLAGHTVVHLDVSFAQAQTRLRGDVGRPMLQRPGLGRLHAERGSVYASVATMTVLTDGRGAQAIAGEVLDRLIGSKGLLVAAPGSSYRVLVRPGLLAEATAELPLAGVATVLLVSRDDEPALAPLRSGLAAAGVVVQAVVVPGGPTPDLALDLVPPRADLVVAVGDAAVMDGARGFATHRDVPLALVPRSLQAQVECVLGGGYDPSSGETPGYRPVVVLGDPVGITPASDPRFGAGLAAAVRIALVADPDALELLVASAAAVLAGEVDALTGLVRRSVTTSARVLTQDASVGRVHLSYGDEFAHAFERLLGAQDMAALPWGLMAAAHLARRLGMIDATVVDRHREVLCAFGLATAARFSWEAVQHAWSRPEMLRPEMYRPDRFVLLHAPGRAEAGVLADDGALRGALDDLAEDR